jgi:ribosomal protein S27AE
MDYMIDAEKSWTQMLKEREIRECSRCTALIANHPSYGRKPNPADKSLCECCPVIA